MSDKALHKFDNIVFKKNLIEWYNENKRDLPWRRTDNPYKIWVSEVMLQQTKVDTVISYYKNFLHRYPTIFDLAASDEQDVLKEWEGLGYYSRARNLREAAREVVATYDGELPKTPSELGALKGIGPYTQGAISSIAYNQPEPAVDGNVMRVLSRVLYIKDNISEHRTRKRFENIVKELICKNDPSSFNQGLMELGALICTPKSPACLLCPVQSNCRAFHQGKEEQLPVKLRKKKPKVISYVVLLIRDAYGNIAIEQRPNKGLLANMWQFPMVEKRKYTDSQIAKGIADKYGMDVKLREKLGRINHVFSHLIWDLHVYSVSSDSIDKSTLTFVSKQKLAEFPFSVSHLKVQDYLT